MLTQIGSYQLKYQLGEGGMATVWYAENALGKEFAIKVLKPDLMQYEHAADRFRNEAKMMVNLRHPHIRQVIDYYEDETTMAIIMEYLEGQDLFQYIAKHGLVDEIKVTKWFESVLDAVAYVHDKNYFHRDIKPSNLFLTDEGLIKVMDFGIAKLINSDLNLTSTAMSIGSPQYMSPEQIMTPKQVDYRTDIYSLGVTLYALLSGRKPYDDSAGSVFTVHREIIQEALPTLRGVSARVNNVIQKATRKAPADRFQSCREFKLALTRNEEDATLVQNIAYEKPTEVQQRIPYGSNQTAEPKTFQHNPGPSIGIPIPPPLTPQPPPLVYTTPTSVPQPGYVPGLITPSIGHPIQINVNQTNTSHNPASQRPGNWLGGAIFVTLFCFWPLGIASILFATKVNPSFNAGDVDGAWSNASKAKTCFWIGLFLTPLSWYYGFGTVYHFIYSLL